MNNEIELLHEDIERASSLSELMLDKKFQDVFLKGYIEEGGISLIKNLTKVKPEERQPIMERMIGMSRFMTFMDEVNDRAANAREYLQSLNEPIEETNNVL